MKACWIAVDKRDGFRTIIPGCYSMSEIDYDQEDDLRQVIRDNCTCTRPSREKYETSTHNELLTSLAKLKDRMARLEESVKETREWIDHLETEIYIIEENPAP